jgi:hypothetical protein
VFSSGGAYCKISPDLPIDFDKTTGETYGRMWQRQTMGFQDGK